MILICFDFIQDVELYSSSNFILMGLNSYKVFDLVRINFIILHLQRTQLFSPRTLLPPIHNLDFSFPIQDTVRLTCTSSSSRPPATLSWTLNDQKVISLRNDIWTYMESVEGLPTIPSFDLTLYLYILIFNIIACKIYFNIQLCNIFWTSCQVSFLHCALIIWQLTVYQLKKAKKPKRLSFEIWSDQLSFSFH